MQRQSSYKVHLNTICNGELSDPICDSVHRGLPLVRLHCMRTTIKEYAYYAAKIHKNELKNVKRSLSPGSAFALSTFGSLYSEAVLGTVRLIANKIKGCKSLRLFNHLPIVHLMYINRKYTNKRHYIFHVFENDG